MYSRKALAWLTAAVTSLALTAGAHAQTGQSPNGPPGPEGNPNQPQDQGNPPPGPQGNPQNENAPARQESAPNGEAKGHSKPNPAPRSKKPQSKSNHRNPNPGTPRKGGREDRPSPKITLCHATGSESNPYVEITISENGLNGHGHHHAKEGRWDDIIPAPAGGCPGTAPNQTSGGGENNTTTTTVTETTTQQQTTVVAPERVTDLGQGAVLGAQAEGGSEDAPAGVLGAQAEGGSDAPAAARETRKANVGSLPFTGLELAFIVLLGVAALLGGFALRRALARGA